MSSFGWHVKEEGTVGPAARVCKQFTDLLGGGPTDGRATRPKVRSRLVTARGGEVEFKTPAWSLLQRVSQLKQPGHADALQTEDSNQGRVLRDRRAGMVCSRLEAVL